MYICLNDETSGVFRGVVDVFTFFQGLYYI